MKISEIAYGSEKARISFQRYDGTGFTTSLVLKADNIPLMIEAILCQMNVSFWTSPKSQIRKSLIQDFPVFSQSSVEPGEELPIPKDFLPDGADEVIDLFQKLLEHRLKNAPKENREQQAEGTCQRTGYAKVISVSRNWIPCWRLPCSCKYLSRCKPSV